MKRHSVLLLGACTSALILAGCATQPTSKSHYEASSRPVIDDATMLGYRIRNWSAVNDRTLIVESSDGTRYKAEMMGPCQGLGFTNRVGFVNRGGFQQIDRFSSVVLPDGTRCAFQSFSKLATPESNALDSFEKLGKPGNEAAIPQPKPN